jgi:hypothetical protein
MSRRIRVQGVCVRTGAAALAVVLGLSAAGCALLPDRVSRPDAVEACELARRLFEPAPNPRAGQPVPPSNRSTLTPERQTTAIEPNTIRPTRAVLQTRNADIRLAALRSGDRQLESALPSLEAAAESYFSWRSLAAPSDADITAARDRAARERDEFLSVCRRRSYA